MYFRPRMALLISLIQLEVEYKQCLVLSFWILKALSEGSILGLYVLWTQCAQDKNFYACKKAFKLKLNSFFTSTKLWPDANMSYVRQVIQTGKGHVRFYFILFNIDISFRDESKLLFVTDIERIHTIMVRTTSDKKIWRTFQGFAKDKLQFSRTSFF